MMTVHGTRERELMTIKDNAKFQSEIQNERGHLVEKRIDGKIIKIYLKGK